MPYNPAQFVKDFSGLERGLTSAISKAGIAIGDYVQTVSDNKAMDELKNGLIDGYTQQRVDTLGENEGKARMNATRLFQPRLKGESNESLFRRWEIAGKNAKQQLASQRQKQVAKQTTEAKGGGFFPAGQGTQISGPPVQGPLQPGQEKIPSQAEQMGLRTPPLQPQAFTGPRETQEGIASSLAARSTMQGQPQPTVSELKEQPVFATAPTQSQVTAQQREARIKDYQSARLELQNKRLENKVDDEYIKLARLKLAQAKFEFQKEGVERESLDFLIGDAENDKKFAKKSQAGIEKQIEEIKTNPVWSGEAKAMALDDLNNQLVKIKTLITESEQAYRWYITQRSRSGTTTKSTPEGLSITPPKQTDQQPETTQRSKFRIKSVRETK